VKRVGPSSVKPRRAGGGGRQAVVVLNFRLNEKLDEDHEILMGLARCRDGDRSSFIRSALLAHVRSGHPLTAASPATKTVPPDLAQMAASQLKEERGDLGVFIRQVDPVPKSSPAPAPIAEPINEPIKSRPSNEPSTAGQAIKGLFGKTC